MRVSWRSLVSKKPVVGPWESLMWVFWHYTFKGFKFLFWSLPLRMFYFKFAQVILESEWVQKHQKYIEQIGNTWIRYSLFWSDRTLNGFLNQTEHYQLSYFSCSCMLSCSKTDFFFHSCQLSLILWESPRYWPNPAACTDHWIIWICRGFIKGRPPDKLTSCEDGFATWTS